MAFQVSELRIHLVEALVPSMPRIKQLFVDERVSRGLARKMNENLVRCLNPLDGFGASRARENDTRVMR